jgi:hypothetical protein
MLLPGLVGFSGGTARERRAALADASDSALEGALYELAVAMRAASDASVGELAAAAALPVGEVVASPMGMRAIALAAQQGGSSVHLELRADVPWPDAFADARHHDIATDPHGYWDRGILHTGKYRGFFADAPLGVWNPNHMAKWGPHELMHRAVGFLWRHDHSRFEAYLGARLNELVPVVLWYGLDEAMRLDGRGWSRAEAARSPSAPVNEARWRIGDDSELRALAAKGVAPLRSGLAHFAREWRAIEAEAADGVVRSTPAEGLDASSDAIAYVVGHYPRLCSPAFAAYAEHMLREGQDYEATVGAYMARVEQAFDALLFGAIAFDASQAAEARRRRRLLDRCWRVAHHGRIPAHQVERMLASAASRVATGGVSVEALAEWDAEAAAGSPKQAFAVALATGHPEDAVWPSEVIDGIASIAPAWLAWAEEADVLSTVLASFARSDAWHRAPLSERLSLAVQRYSTPAAWSLWCFEVALAARRGVDDVVERLGTPIEEVPEGEEAFAAGVVHASAAFASVALSHDPAPAHRAWSEGQPLVLEEGAGATYVVGPYLDGVSVVPAPGVVADVWEHVVARPQPASAVLAALADAPTGDGLPASAEGWLEEWIAAGAVRWMPALRSTR